METREGKAARFPDYLRETPLSSFSTVFLASVFLQKAQKGLIGTGLGALPLFFCLFLVWCDARAGRSAPALVFGVAGAGVALVFVPIREWLAGDENALFAVVDLPLFSACRNAVSEVFGKSEAGAFLKAVTIGARTELPESVTEAFRRSYALHLLAISGLHVGIIKTVTEKLLLPIPKRARTALLSAFLLFLFFFAGAAAPVGRAVLMLLYAALAALLGRPVSGRNALLFAATVLVLFSPAEITQASFLMSFAAVFGILELALPAARDLNARIFSSGRPYRVCRLLSAASSPLLLMIGVFVATLPVELYFFGEEPVFSMFYNLILVPLFVPVIVCAIFAALGALLPPFTVFIAPALYLAQRYLDLVRFVSQGAPETLTVPQAKLFAFGAVALFAALCRKKAKIVSILSALWGYALSVALIAAFL